MTRPTDDSLESFETDLRSEIDGRFGRLPMPDFKDVLERMQAENPSALPESAISNAHLHDDDSLAEAGPPLSDTEAEQLASINADARQLLDHALGQRELAPIPMARPKAHRGPKWSWAAAAAVLLLGGVAAASVARSYLGADASTEHSAEQAQDLAQDRDPDSGTARGSVESDTAEPRPGPASSNQSPSPEASWPPSELAPAEADPPTSSPATPSPSTGAGSKSKPQTELLQQLDAEAYALFRSGDLPGAEKKFSKLTRIGGRSQYAEIAFGELFSIARQRHGAARRAELWRGYLRRFPRGRYADAARAGLCRMATGSKATKCWNRYLKRHPTGVARGEAMRETTDGQ